MKSILVLTVFCGSALVCQSSVGQESPVAVPQDMHLFLLIGQSNMAGRGKVADADQKPIGGVMMLDKENKWAPAVDPLHFDKPKMVGVGLGRSFAAEVLKSAPNATIGLIPCAVGGSPISAWKPGGFHKQTKTHPYDDMLARLEVALKSGKVKAILWHQGESDSNQKSAPHYEANLRALVKRLRDRLGDDTTLLIGQLGQFAERPWNEYRKQVDAAHQSVAKSIGRAAFVSSEGLKHKGDKTHFDAGSYREFGRRYAKAYASINQPVAAK